MISLLLDWALRRFSPMVVYGLVGLAALGVVGGITYKIRHGGVLSERARWEQRVSDEAKRRSAVAEKARLEAEKRAADMEATNAELQRKVGEIEALARRAGGDRVCLPADVTRRLRALR
jgi:hypothetical protein